MTIPENLLSAFRYWRRPHARPISAMEALRLSRDDVSAGKRRYASSAGYGTSGSPFKAYGSRHMRWIESPSAAGLRFVGYADKLAKLDHNGWFLDNDQNETVRGVVYQLAGRNGVPLFVSGYEDPHNGSADSDGPACLDFASVTEGEAPEWIKPRDGWSGYWSYSDNAADHDGARDAARHADSIAESYAESEREHSAAWSAGQSFATLGAEIKAARSHILDLLAERRAARKAGISGEPFAAICGTIRAAVASSLESIGEARAEREKLKSGEYVNDWTPGFWTGDPGLVAAFNEGAEI